MSSLASSGTYFNRFLIIFGFLLTIAGTSRGQTIGVDLCACSPAIYNFTFDFGLTCPPVNVTRNGGVAATFCQISPVQSSEKTNITDLVPVSLLSPFVVF